MLKKRLAGNFKANVYQQAVGVAIQLGSIPLFLAFWSKQHYGEWLLISSVPSYLSLGEAGFATYAATEVSIFAAKSSMEEARRTLHTAWGFLLGMSVALISVGSLVMWLVPWQSVLRLPADERDIRLVIALLGLYTIIGLASTIFDAIYRGNFLAPRSVIMVSSGRLLELGVTIVCVAVSSSMVVLAAALLAARVLETMVLFVDTRVCSPHLRLGLSAFAKDELQRIWKPSILYLTFSFGSAAYFQGLTLVVGLQFGAVALVTFNITRTLSRVIVQFVTMVKHSAWPEFSYLYGAGEIGRARVLNRLVVEVSWVACTVLAVGIYLGGPWLMLIWTHHAVVADKLLLALLLASAVLNGIWFVESGLLMGVNRHEGLAVRYAIASVVAIAIGISLSPWLGLYASGVAMVCCDGLLVPYTIREACRVVDDRPRSLIADSLHLTTLIETIRAQVRRGANPVFQDKPTAPPLPPSIDL